MAGKIKLYFDAFETTFTAHSSDTDLGGAHDPSHLLEAFYLAQIAKAKEVGVGDPETLSLSAMQFGAGRVRQIVPGMSQAVVDAIGSFHSIKNLEITYLDLRECDLTPIFAHLTRCEHINLANTRISSLPLPAPLAAKLLTLSLENNAFVALPSVLKHAKALTTLVLTQNPLSIATPKCQALIDASATEHNAQEILREMFAEEETIAVYSKYHEQLIEECIKPLKEYIRSETASSSDTPDVTLGVQLSKFPHELNLNSSYYRHIYLSFMLYYRIYFQPEGELKVRVDEKNLFGALSNAKYEFQARRKKGTVSLIDQYEIFFFWMYVAKPFVWSESLKGGTTEVLSLVHIFTACKILEEINLIPVSKNVLGRSTIQQMRDIISVRPEDPMRLHDSEHTYRVRKAIRAMIEGIIPSDLQRKYSDYGEGEIKNQIEKKLINLQSGD